MKQLFFMLFLASSLSFSQTKELGKFKDPKKTHLNEYSKEYFIFYTDSIEVFDIKSFKKLRSLKPENITNFYRFNYFLVALKQQNYLVEGLGGKVYQIVGDEFKRIDNSFTHKMQIGSYIFNYQDKIYKYGGYGFWSDRNFFTYFDLTTKEWEILSPTRSKEIPNGSFNSFVDIKDTNLYVYGGMHVNPIEPKENIINDNVWKFDISNKKWDFLGTSKINLEKYLNSISYLDKRIFLDESNNLVLVDVANNKLKIYNRTSVEINVNNLLKSFYHEGIFYFICRIYATNDSRLLAIPEKEFFGELIREEKFYYNNEKIYYSISIILLIGMSILIYFNIRKWNKKRNRITVNEDSLMYKGKVIPFDEKSIKVLNLLLYSTEEVIFSELIDINENKELNYAHKTRVVNTLIDEINFKLKAFISVKQDLITFQKSDLDKRIKVYTIDKEYFYLDKNKIQ